MTESSEKETKVMLLSIALLVLTWPFLLVKVIFLTFGGRRSA